jgi:hypothetical protein
VRERLVVLGLRERVDRAELLAPALEALDALAQLDDLLVGQRLLGGLGGQAEPLGERPELLVGLGAWSRACCARTSAAGDRLVAGAQPALDLGLLGRAGAQLGGDALAGGAVGGELGSSASCCVLPRR